jgi:hypothetical protein
LFFLSQLLKAHMFEVMLFATVLQIVGTTVLALFSFYGIEVSENTDAYVEGIQKVEVSVRWLRASQCALVALLVGIVLSGGVSLASAS